VRVSYIFGFLIFFVFFSIQAADIDIVKDPSEQVGVQALDMSIDKAILYEFDHSEHDALP
jgi:hypothetical protein